LKVGAWNSLTSLQLTGWIEVQVNSCNKKISEAGIVVFVVLAVCQYFFWPDKLFYAQDDYDVSCFHQHAEIGSKKIAMGSEGMQSKARKALNGLNNIEYENFDLLSECVNTNVIAQERARMKVHFNVLVSSGWKKSSLLEAAREASSVYAQCGIYFDDINVSVIDASRHYRNINWIELYQVAAATRRDTWPHVYFVKKEKVSARSREALGLAIHQKFVDRALPAPAFYAEKFDIEQSELDYSIIQNIAVIIERKRNSNMGAVIAHDSRQCATVIAALENFETLAMSETR